MAKELRRIEAQAEGDLAGWLVLDGAWEVGTIVEVSGRKAFGQLVREPGDKFVAVLARSTWQGEPRDTRDEAFADLIKEAAR